MGLLMGRNMTTSLIEHDRIRTTVPRAKELRRVAEQMVTLAKSGGECVKAMRRRRSEGISARCDHGADEGGDGSAIRRSRESLQVGCR